MGNKHICWMNADSKHVNVCTVGPMCVCVCVYMGWGVCMLGWEAESAAHHPTHQAQRLGLLMSSLAMLCGPPPPPSPPRTESMLTEQLLRWTHTHRITHTPTHTHRHAVKSAVFPFDQAGVPYVSSGKIRRWCLRWLRVCVPMWACERGAVCRLSYRYGSTLVSVSVVLHFK